MTEPLPPLHDRRFAIEPMSRELSGAFIRLNFAERGKSPMSIEALKQDLGPDALRIPQVAIIVERIEAAALSGPEMLFTPEVVLLAAYMCTSPGKCVIWAWELVYLARRRPCDLMAVSIAFANGFPTEAAMTEFWDLQKDRGANSLDRPETWKGEQP